MRHNKKINHLGRTASHRKALMANMACSLIMHKRITTTIAKAKALKMYAEPLLTKSKEDTTHSRRIVFSYLKQKEAVTELFREIAPRVADRPGGYCRILKTGFRQGDAADMCIIEFVDFNETYTTKEALAAAKPKTRRSRSATAKKVAVAETETPAEKSTGKAAPKKPAAKKEEPAEPKKTVPTSNAAEPVVEQVAEKTEVPAEAAGQVTEKSEVPAEAAEAKE